MLTFSVIFLIGLLLISLSIISFYNTPSLILQQIHENLKLKQDSQTVKLWKDVSLPIYNKFYFFNVTNGEAIEREGVKPILKEIGPFTYKVKIKKNIIQYNSNGTISYREKKIWIFDRKLSLYDDNTLITTLNTPLAITLTLIQRASSTIRVLLTLALDAVTEGFFIKRTVRQLLFEGYPDLLTTFGSLINPEITTHRGRFGFMYSKNNTDDGIYNVFSGIDNITKINLIDNYNGENNLKYWSSSYCNNLNNTTNGQLRPPLNNETIIKIFLSDICRVLRFIYKKTYKTKQGLLVRRYKLDSNTFKNFLDYPPNVCYISEFSTRVYKERNRGSTQDRLVPLPSGVFDISKCRHGIPIFISQPHFLNGNKYYRKTVNGLKPNIRKHNFWLDIDPLTGTTVNLSARLQLNVAIHKLPGMLRYRFIPEIIFPIFWQEYNFQSTIELAERIMDASQMPEKISSISFYSLLSLGIFLLLISLIIYIIPTFRIHSLEINHKHQSDTIKSIGRKDTKEILEASTNN